MNENAKKDAIVMHPIASSFFLIYQCFVKNLFKNCIFLPMVWTTFSRESGFRGALS